MQNTEKTADKFIIADREIEVLEKYSDYHIVDLQRLINMSRYELIELFPSGAEVIISIDKERVHHIATNSLLAFLKDLNLSLYISKEPDVEFVLEPEPEIKIEKTIDVPKPEMKVLSVKKVQHVEEKGDLVSEEIPEVEIETLEEAVSISDIEEKSEASSEGWCLTEGTRKHHYFVGGISVCSAQYEVKDYDSLIELDANYKNSCQECRDLVSSQRLP